MAESTDLPHTIYCAARDGQFMDLLTFLSRITEKEIPLYLEKHFSSDGNTFTPFIVAAMNGHDTIIRMLLERFHTNIEQEGIVKVGRSTFEGATALLCASIAGHCSIVKYLLLRGADVNHSTNMGSTPLIVACHKNFLYVVQCLIENGADINKGNKKDYTCLMHSAYLGHVDIVSYLINKGADIDATDHIGETALHCAAEMGHLETMKILLKAGAKISKNLKGKTALLKAADRKNCEVVKHFVKKCIFPKTESVEALKVLDAPHANDKNDNVANRKGRILNSGELRCHDTLKHFDKKIVDVVLNELIDFSPNVRWADISGLEFVKKTVQEIVMWPLLRPDIFSGLRSPPSGILLFGPPGSGKTLIGKCIATESKATFFCIGTSSLASKYVGESEQMVRVLFAAARLSQPAIIFIDEIDSLLSQRSTTEDNCSRKLKTEILIQMDGAKTNTEDRVLVVGATNRPAELDEAARRRFVKRLYVPLPDEAARKQIIAKLIGAHHHNLSEADIKQVCDETEGYSGSDVTHLCKEAAMGPIRSISPEYMQTVSMDQVRPITLCDFSDALRQVRASVRDDLRYYIDWNEKFGSFGV